MEAHKFEVVISNEREIAKPVLALTNCEVVFSTRDDLEKCIVAVKESDQRLAARPVDTVLYDWHIPTVVRGLTLFFGVRWYDLGYFEKNRDVYKNQMHGHLFAKFGVSADSFSVRHFVAS